MKISLLISAIIIGIASFFGFSQKEKIKTLTSEWEELKTTALKKKISIDPKTTFSSQRIRSESTRATRQKAISDFAHELAAFAQKMELAEESGTTAQSEIQKETIKIISKLTNMSPTDLKALVKALSTDNSLKDDSKNELIMMSIMMLSSENPEAALAIISESHESLNLGQQSEHLLPIILSQYASTDPKGAALWIIENEKILDHDSDEIKNSIVTMVAQNNIASALDLIDTLKIKDSSHTFASLAQTVNTQNHKDFIKALRSQDFTDEQQNAAFASLSFSPFMEDFETASNWLAGPDLSDSEKEKITANLYYHGVRNSASQWLSWISENQISAEAGKQATSRIISGWTQENFVAAGEWIQNQKTGPLKNAAILSYAETLAPQEPAAAADWASVLPQSPERTSLLQVIHRSLKEKDPNAAANFAKEHQLELE